ncbi:MAG: TATA-box-binding protein, partial [Nanoarchaeota archaeon]|nr:TATA-box-binding protein [Nanoarchaeota archaeon]
LKKNGVKITVTPKLKVQNMVGSGSVGFDLNLNELALKLDNVEYEPEQFPGLVYKIKDPFHSTFLLFSNGKIVCTGAKTEEEMNLCLEQLVKNLNKFVIKMKS